MEPFAPKNPRGEDGYYGTGRRPEPEGQRLPLILGLLLTLLAANLITVIVCVRAERYAQPPDTPDKRFVTASQEGQPNDATGIEAEIRTDPTLGMELSALDEAERRYWSLPEGVIVQRVVPGTAARAAGLQAGDILTACNGVSLSDVDRYLSLIAESRPGDSIELTLYRSGAQRTVTLTRP